MWLKDFGKLNKLSPTFMDKKFKVIERVGPRTKVRSEDGQPFSRWVSALKKTPDATRNTSEEVKVGDSVWINKDDNLPPPRRNRFKVLAEHDDIFTTRNEKGSTMTCNKESAVKAPAVFWDLDDVPITEPEPQEPQEERSPKRQQRKKEKPKWLKDFKLYNVFG